MMSAAMTLVSIPLVGLVRVDGTTLLLATTLATPMAPVYALFFAAFAQNKVQGFAIMKATGVILWPPIIA
jgi:fluoroquinolone transport system permease protein